ncbi:MAG: cytochrome C [Zetaproteobacteria bacterium CG12_big_fil_rev_8_21_14_0_65_54_13]|nr:MAG: cytochrome C [Zetaproteobacteria bacterium CG23_combo_of_CG06-09_8_20_14_all_54_7]PIW50593.1 MAG: cytochrome C [Zetaproteobacteria bacterium CG12_big_fil_rev_8_21_14_0_65_54_13]PIX54431.1 MAG: cytochrome C [Zetaproteobacteria bacterium CG_4_10_14_3_um_filter_54_28]PJA28831.1 MAG: cytochrome C [Zetaproteobacteria bacterium CG_4_9_14_3_um_filter_54_145]
MKKIMMITAAAAMAMGAMSVTAYAGAEGKCKACHTFTAANKVGPGLAGVVGRAAGKHEGFKYSTSLGGANWNWDEAHLRAWVCNSKDAIKEFTGDDHAKTKMPPQKICDAAKQDELIAFLKAQ